MRMLGLIAICLCSGILTGQNTFNSVWHHPSGLSYVGAHSVFELNDGYLVFAYGWSLDSTVGAIHVAKFTSSGDLLWQKEHRRERYIHCGYVDPIARISDTCFVASMTEFGGDAPNVTYLYWFNAEADTIRTRFLKSDSLFAEGTHATHQLIKLSDGGFLHCGWCAGFPSGTESCITRVDSIGEILWDKNYPQARYIFNATELPDGGFILGGNRNSDQNKAVIIRTDSMGNAQWTRYHGSYSITGGNQALYNIDGNILMPGSWKQDPNTTVYDRWTSLYKYSSTGVPLDRKDYFFSYDATAVHILPKDDANFWLVGGMYQYGVDPDGVLTLWELDENLDSLWMRRYWHYASDDAVSAAYSIRSTSDGGLVMCGMTRQGVLDILPYLQSNWLIKLDEHGCLVPGCHMVGINEHVLGLNEYFKLWPNPVQAETPIQFSFEPPEGFVPKGQLRAVLLDAMGREVHSESFAITQKQFTLQKTDLPTGIYHLHLTDQRSWLAGAKVVVE